MKLDARAFAIAAGIIAAALFLICAFFVDKAALRRTERTLRAS